MTPMALWKQVGWLVALALLPALLSAVLHPRRPDWRISAAHEAGVSLEKARRFTTALWLDARSAEAYAREHVPGALPLNESQWEEQFPAVIQAWQPGTMIVVYCDNRECRSSLDVVLRLRREMDIAGVFALEGGWSAWRADHP